MRARRDCGRYSAGATLGDTGDFFPCGFSPAFASPVFVRAGQGVVTVAVVSPPPVGSALCSEDILQLGSEGTHF